jgi:hypothetical protein
VVAILGAVGIYAATDTNPFVLGGTATGAVALLSLLIRELRRSGESVWRLVMSARADTHRARYDLAVEKYLRDVAETRLRICLGLAPEGTEPRTPDPGPYVEPTDKELRSWL